MTLLEMTRSGVIWDEPEFSNVSPALRRLNDIAFSGDGEPTTYPQFSEAVRATIECRAAAGFAVQDVKIVLITNATMFHRPEVRAGLQLLKEANGEIWAKLDAGTPEYYDLIDKTNVPYERILRNIETIAHEQPLNIQTCMMRTHGTPPSDAETEAYCTRLNTILAAGGNIKAVQLYTVARRPPNEWVTSLNDMELNDIAAKISERTGLYIETFGGSVGL
jgi:wyosine [tRNA(Phe)-imidazoG37] synthetase (radical SAM superfamily)